MDHDPHASEMRRFRERRDFLRRAVAGTVVAALGGLYALLEAEPARAEEPEKRPDGRLRVPPGQRVIERLKPMGGREGDPNPRKWRLRVHGEVEQPLDLSWPSFLALPQVDKTLDVHCVTAWTVLGAAWRGVSIRHLAEKAKVKEGAKFVILEAAHGYTANLPIDEALAAGQPARASTGRQGAAPPPRRAGARRRARPLLLEERQVADGHPVRPGATSRATGRQRGYHNHADPWKEERYA